MGTTSSYPFIVAADTASDDYFLIWDVSSAAPRVKRITRAELYSTVIPSGGTTGQVLAKADAGGLEWADASSGSSFAGKMVGGIGVVSHTGTANFSFSGLVGKYTIGSVFEMHSSITGALKIAALPDSASGVRVGCTVYASATAGHSFFAQVWKNGSVDYSSTCPGARVVVPDDGYVRISLSSGRIYAENNDYFTVQCHCMNPSTLDYSSWTEQPNETNFWIEVV